MEAAGEGPEHTVMVGDQVFTDVVAGNLAGVRTILVRPQCRRDLWYTYIFRVFERLALLGKKFEGSRRPTTPPLADGPAAPGPMPKPVGNAGRVESTLDNRFTGSSTLCQSTRDT